MSPATGTGLGIPRLQELQFLETAMTAVTEGRTYDEVRRALITHMDYVRRNAELAGNHAGRRPRPSSAEEGRYFHNTNECLTELMRLGWVERAALPSSRKALEGYRGATFVATTEGSEWAELAGTNLTQAYDELLRGLWRIHPQFAGYLRVLANGRVRIPIAGWQEVHPDLIDDHERVRAGARRGYVEYLAERVAGAVEAGATGWIASHDEILASIIDYTNRLDARARARDKDAFPRNRDFAGACEEALVSFAFSRLGLRVDFITVEILRRWMRTLNVAGFSYHVPGPSTLTLWRTADVRDDDPQAVAVLRRDLGAYSPRIVDELPRVFNRAADQVQGSFVPIHMVRAGVCSALEIPEAMFDRVLRDLVNGTVGGDRPFKVHLDPASYGALPPTERPFVVSSRGRDRPFYVMTLINQPERNPE